MAKKCKLEHTKRMARLINLHAEKRARLVAVIKDPAAEQADKTEAYRKLAKLPRDSSRVRYKNRCDLTGRPKAYYRKFRISRIALRELALEGKLPGVKKSSW